jgi:hypothetical protein
MGAIPDNARKLSYDTVAAFAPNELPLFDEIWEDMADGREVSLPDVAHGSGIDAQTWLLTTVVIPIIVGVLKDQVSKSIEVLTQLLRKKSRNRMEEAKAAQIAEHILRRLSPPPE